MKALALLTVLLAGPALAESTLFSRFTLGLETQGAISLTPARTQGGVGGGAVLTFSLDEHWLLDAHAGWLFGLGSHSLFRVGGGWQRSGTWRPLLRAGLVMGLGGSLDFSVRGSLPSRAPTLGLVMGIAALRFQVGRAVVSALELEAGASTEFVAVGPRLGLTLIAISAPLGE